MMDKFELTDEELKYLQKELDDAKSNHSDYNDISSCNHIWFNTGLTVQGESLMVCTKCRKAEQARMNYET